MKKKIVFFTESMELMGGMERVIAFLANHFQDEYEVIILTMYGTTSPYFDVSCPIKSLDINIAPINGSSKLKRYFLTWHKVRSFLKENSDIDYFIANSSALCCSMLLANLGLKNNIKLIAFEHCEFGVPGKFWKFVRQNTFSKCHRVIALTKDSHEKYLAINVPSIHLPNAIAISTNNLVPMKNKKLLAVGRLEYVKGFDSLLYSWKDILIDHPDWVLEIVGDGSEKERLKSIAKELNIQNNVIFFGQSINMNKRYLDASGFVFSSRSEGFGLVLIEAMAHGLPCISFDCDSGPRDIIENGMNGYLVEDQNISELTNKIKQYIALTDEDKQKMSQCAKQTSLKYSPDIIIDRWYKDVLND